MTNNTYRTGQFVWREIMTTDMAATTRFYTEVFGWKAETMKMPDGNDYAFCKIGDLGVAGMMKHPMAGVPAYWSGSVSVTDVDDTAKRAAAAGGKVVVPPMDAGGMGRYTGFIDPQGAMTNAWKGTEGDGPASMPPGVGSFCWEQLNTTAPADAFAFYSKVFNWTEKPMAADPSMKLFAAGSTEVASVMQAPPGVPAHWLSYVVVDKLTDSYGRIKAQGGKVMVERIDVPTIGAIGVFQDNVGAVLGVFELPSP